MSNKGLEELKKIKNYKEWTTIADITGFKKEKVKLAYNDELKPSFKIIEKELEEYESHKTFIDNVKNNLIVFTPKDTWEAERNKLKALEIIYEKDVNVLILKYAFISSEGVKFYNKHFENDELHLTQEEFDLLKKDYKGD